MSAAALLEANDVSAHYVSSSGPDVQAIGHVSMQLYRGEILGVAGESGCGKSTFASVVALTARPPLYVVGGDLVLDGEKIEITQLEHLPRSMHGKLVALLPQGAMNSLNPTSRVRDLAYDVISAHEPHVTKKEAFERARERLEELSLPVRVLESYPHQLSGGMKQRVVAVISTLLNPKVLIADEPTSALDVSAQHALTQQLRELLDRGLVQSIMFITHDLPLLSTVADRIAIMYAGLVAEVGSAREVVDHGWHPYTRALMQAVLAPEPGVRRKRIEGIPGAPPDMRYPPEGCPYQPRCPLRMDICKEDPPAVGAPHRFARCWWVKEHLAELEAQA